MTALSDALAAAQSRAVAALGKQYVGGQLDGDALRIALDGIGLRDPSDTDEWIAALDVIRETGAALPRENGGGAKTDEPATDAQFLPDRFVAKYVVNAVTGCWEWTATTDGRGYGNFQSGRISRGGHPSPEKAHRVAYEALVGPVPEGLQLDHLCRNRRCVNPAHLEPVTCQENVRRGYDTGYCRHGHPREIANTYVRPDGRIECRDCRTEREAAA